MHTRALLLLLLPLCAAPAAAQTAFSGSANYVAQLRAVRSAGGTITSGSPWSVGSAAEVVLGGATAGPSTSANHLLWAGFSRSAEFLKNTPPILFAAAPDSGPKAGGGVTTVTGFGFDWIDGGPAALALDGQPLAGVAVSSNTQLTAPVPPGENALTDFALNPIEGNPLGGVDLTATTQLGAHTLSDGYAYLPALLQTSPARVDDVFGVRFRSSPGAMSAMSAGFTTPGQGIPIGSLEGALEIWFGLVSVGLVTADAEGVHDYELLVPDNPNLAGNTVWLQTLSIDSLVPLTWWFSNVLEVVIEG